MKHLREFMLIVMETFKLFVATLDTPGGHMLTCIALIFIGVAISKLGIQKEGEGLITTVSGVLIMAMRGQNGKGAGVTKKDESPLLPPVEPLTDAKPNELPPPVV